LPGARDVTAINTGWFESLAFVMSRQNRIAVLDLMEFRKLGDIELPGSPGAGVVTSNGQKLYTTLSDVNQVAVVDTQTHRLRALIDDVGRQPAGVILARSNNYCH
jgi:YVTN family beta-propeller protein